MIPELDRLIAAYQRAYLEHERAATEADTAEGHARETRQVEINTCNAEQAALSALLAHIEGAA